MSAILDRVSQGGGHVFTLAELTPAWSWLLERSSAGTAVSLVVVLSSMRAFLPLILARLGLNEGSKL
jgi:hypothetical protein